jgi:hypothetical protein
VIFCRHRGNRPRGGVELVLSDFANATGHIDGGQLLRFTVSRTVDRVEVGGVECPGLFQYGQYAYAEAPALAAGAHDVQAFADGGVTPSNVIEDAYEAIDYIDPLAAAPTNFWRAHEYTWQGAGVPSSAGKWFASVGTDLAAASLAPPSEDGAPHFSTSHEMLRNTTVIADVYGIGNRHIVMAIELDRITSSFASARDNAGITTASGQMGLTLRRSGSGPYQYFVEHYEFNNFSTKKASAEVTSILDSDGAGRLVVQGKKEGGFLWVRVGSSAWIQGDSCPDFDGSLASAATDQLRVGHNYASNAFVEGRMLALGLYDSAQNSTFSDGVPLWAEHDLQHRFRWMRRAVGNLPPEWILRDGSQIVQATSGRILLGDGWSPSEPFELGQSVPYITNEIWGSDDEGESWTLLLAHVQTPPTSGAGARQRPSHCRPWVRLGGKIVVVGTEPAVGAQRGDVWESSDNGATWARICTDAPTENFGVYMVGRLGADLYIMGGQTDPSNPATGLSSVYRSSDGGATWTQLTDAPWDPRGMVWHPCEHKGKLYVVSGGLYDGSSPSGSVAYNDVWRFDGTSWEEVLADGHGQFVGAIHVSLASVNGRLWLLNGHVPSTTTDLLRAAYSDDDGATWAHFDNDANGAKSGGMESHADAAGVGTWIGGEYLLRVTGSISDTSRTVHRIDFR